MSCTTRSTPLLSILLLLGATSVLFMADPAHPTPNTGIGFPTDTLLGSAADDVLTGSERGDLLEGGGGNDVLIGKGGDDVLRGGGGHDALEGMGGEDVLEGGDGDDHLTGGDDRDFLFGEGGNDVLKGGGGNDVLDGGEGDDQLDGGDGDDALDGREGEDVLRGGAGRDVLDGHDGNDFLDGGPGNDNLDGGDEDDILTGGAGADSLSGGDGNDTLDGGNDDDLLLGNDGADVLRGGNGNDQLAGLDGPDILEGGLGNDLLSGGEGDDVLIGGGGNDTLLASLGDDRLDGGPGDDLLRGSVGDDAITGGPGDDVILGGWGTDPTSAGAGNDRITIRAGDVDSLGIESIEGGVNADTARIEADTLFLEGFMGTDVRVLDLEGHSGWRILDPLTGGVYLVTGVEYLVHSATIPYMAGEVASLLIVNPSASERVVGVLEFVDAAGDTISMSVAGGQTSPRSDFDLPPFGSAQLALTGPPGSGIRILGNQPVVGILDSPGGGNAPSRVTTSSFTEVARVPIYLDRREGISTGVIVRNLTSATALKLEPYTTRGGEGDAREVSVESGAAVVVTLDQLYPGVQSFEGKLLIRGGPVALNAFQVLPGGVTIPTPVLDLGPRKDRGPLVIPHFTVGGGHQTTIRLTSTSPDSLKGGVISFFNEDGRPLEVHLAGIGRVTEAAFVIGSTPTAVFHTASDGARTVGSAIITTASGRPGGTVRLTAPGITPVETAIEGFQDRFLVPVQGGSATGMNSHVALSADENAVTVRLVLHDPDGQPRRGGQATVRLPAGGSTYRALEQLFPRANLQGWRGVLVGEAERGGVGVMVTDVGTTTATAIPVTPIR